MTDASPDLRAGRLSGALLDWLTRHVDITQMNSDRCRLGQGRARKAEASARSAAAGSALRTKAPGTAPAMG